MPDYMQSKLKPQTLGPYGSTESVLTIEPAKLCESTYVRQEGRTAGSGEKITAFTWQLAFVVDSHEGIEQSMCLI